MLDEMSTTMGQVLLFLTTVIGFGIQMYKESRNRKWDLEDRERARKELEAKLEIAKQKVVADHAILVNKIDENTEISRTAFIEANNVNAKFLLLASQLNAPYDRKAADILQHDVEKNEQLLQDTKHVVDDTHAKVEKIEQKIVVDA